MIRVGICDDEKASREMVGGLLKEYFTEKGMEYRQAEFGSGKEFLERTEEIDILLLDIAMGEISGIQLKNMLQREGEDIKILFFSNHIEEMPEAFGRNVYGFLRKPVGRAELGRYLDRMVEDVAGSQSIVIRGFKKEFVVRLKDIFYFVSEKKYSCMVYREGERFCDIGLSCLEEMLKHNFFFRCHRSYLVNLENISKIEGNIYMENGDEVPVSRRKSRQLKDSYQMYVIQKAYKNRGFQEISL